MEKNKSLRFASVVFAMMAVLHMLRSIFNWEVLINGYIIPIWFSYIAVVVAGFLSWAMYDASKGKVLKQK